MKREGKKQRAEERDSVWIGIRRERERKRRRLDEEELMIKEVR